MRTTTLTWKGRLAWFAFGLVAFILLILALDSVGGHEAHAAVPTPDCQTVSKYSGTIPCGSGDDLVKPVASIAIACALGGIGGPEAAIFSCFGAVAGAALG